MDNKNIIKKSIEMEIAIYALDNQYAKRDNDVLSIYHTEERYFANKEPFFKIVILFMYKMTFRKIRRAHF